MIEIKTPDGVDIGYLTSWEKDGIPEAWDGWLTASIVDKLIVNGTDKESAREAVLRKALEKTEEEGRSLSDPQRIRDLAAVRTWLRQQLDEPSTSLVR